MRFWILLLILVAGAAIGFQLAKSRKDEKSPEKVTPAEVPLMSAAISTPIVTPERIPVIVSTPSPPREPPPRLASEGTFFVVKAFSVMTDYGVIGFPVGKEVQLVREDAANYVVTNGEVEGMAPRTSFTNNLDIRDSLLSKKPPPIASIPSPPSQIRTMEGMAVLNTSQNEARMKEREKELFQKKINELETAIRNGEDKIRQFSFARNDYFRQNREATSLSASLKKLEAEIRVLNVQISGWRAELFRLKEEQRMKARLESQTKRN